MLRRENANQAIATKHIYLQHDNAVEGAQALDGQGKCTDESPETCQLMFHHQQVIQRKTLYLHVFNTLWMCAFTSMDAESS